MISIQYLFEDMENSSVPKKYKKRISRKCKIFKGFEDDLPKLSYPLEGTNKFEEDLGEVRRCVRNTSLSKSFLKMSDKDSENIFKNYLKDEDFEWQQLDNALKEFDGVMLREKFKYKRKRPFEYFEDRGEDIDTEHAGSPSFPSGHTAFAYFLCDVLSDRFPDRQIELQTLAEMIGQSRIENGVHFPSDITAGRFLGEQAAKYFIERASLNESKIDKSSHKTFVRHLRRKAQSYRKNFSKKEAYNYFVDDMAAFTDKCCKTADFNESYDSCKHLLSGYTIENCTENYEIRSLFEGMIYLFFSRENNARSIIKLHSLIEEETTVRNFEKSTLSGMSYAPAVKLNELIDKIDTIKNKPFLKLAALSWLSPFESGNEKITNLIFLKESGFNFDIANQIIDDDLDFILENFYRDNDMENILL